MSIQPMRAASDDAARAVAMFGLTGDLLAERVIRPSQRDAARFLDNGYPRGTRGYVLWAERNRHLRMLMEAQGWVYKDDFNVPCLVDSSGARRLVVVRGDHRVGLPGARGPRAVYPRGSATMYALRQNEEYHGFEALRVAEDDRGGAAETWFLILFEDAEQTRVEISLPVSDGISNFGSFRERLLMPSVPHEAGLDIDPQDGAGGLQIDIDIWPN